MFLKQQDEFKNALILQSDWEGGMANMALDLISAGKDVTKVILHAGDWIYRWKGVPTVKYDAPLELFEDWLRNHIKKSGVDCLILYNQYRPYNTIGWSLAKELDIDCLVLEQGLLRPDYCSIYSRKYNEFGYLAKKWNRVLGEELNIPAAPQEDHLARMSTPCKISQFACCYLFSRIVTFLTRKYRHYKDQRTLRFRHHLVSGIRSALLFQARQKQARFNSVFSTKWSGRYYFVPLQVHTDSQIIHRSNFRSMEDFIHEVVESFASHAPKGTKLIFKAHPIDRGYRDYRELIKGLQTKVGGHRILYLDRIHLPTVLDHARACITINSSVGLSALIHNTPTITLGQAAYDLPGLTYRGELNEFWREHGKANKKLIRKFVALLKLTSQAQGTLFQRLYSVPGRCKISWPWTFAPLFMQGPALKENLRKQELPKRPELNKSIQHQL